MIWRNVLISRWTRRVLEDPRVPKANRLSEPELRNQVPELLDSFIHDLDAHDGGEAEGRGLGASDVARTHARHRANEGYSLVEAMRELSHLRAAILDLYTEESVSLEGDAARMLYAALDETMTLGADEMERLIRERDQRIIETAVDAIVTIDEQGTVEALNPAAERMFGYQAGEVVGHNVRVLDARAVPQRARRIPGALPADGRAPDHQHRARGHWPAQGRRDVPGRFRHQRGADCRAPHLHGGAPRPHGAQASRQERERLLQSERAARTEADRAARLRDDFVATVSHELRTPLNAILGWTRMLRGGKLDAAAAAKALDVVERNAKAQAALVEDLLDISRIGSGKARLDVQLVNLSDIVQNAVASHQPAAQAKGVSLDKVLDEHGCTLRGDPGRLEQICLQPALQRDQVHAPGRPRRRELPARRLARRAGRPRHRRGHRRRLPPASLRLLPAGGSVPDPQSSRARARARAGEGPGRAARRRRPCRERGGGPGCDVHGVPARRRSRPGRREPSEIDACAALAGIKVLVVEDDEDARALVARILEPPMSRSPPPLRPPKRCEQFPRVRP